MSQQLIVWRLLNRSPWRVAAHDVRGGAVRLADGGVELEEAPHCPSGVVLTPAVQGSAAGVLLVPAAFRYRAACNGSLLAAGAHLVCHADQVSIDGRLYWVALRCEPDVVAYDPAVHGEVRCARTQAPLRPGQRGVVCPGPPGRRCGAMYGATAWEVGRGCHLCGYDQAAPPWRPEPRAVREGRLDELLELLKNGPR